MAIVNTLHFLPEIFQTDSNQKFLNATLDQLVAEPVLQKINGYIGRTFAPTFKAGDSYIVEQDVDRQHYQLEPGVVVTDSTNKVQFYNNYIDLVNKIQYYGGNTSNHSRLFENETYTFNGRVDFDKLINFSQYYWLPFGPAVVDVFAGQADTVKTFVVVRNSQTGSYQISGEGIANNPDIILARGGTYQFIVDQDSVFADGAVSPQFWIQTNQATSGLSTTLQNTSSRDVYGVINNGISRGTVTFNVPQVNSQDQFVSMPIVSAVDFASNALFNELDNNLLSIINKNLGGIDSITSASSLSGKLMIFVSNGTDNDWQEKGIYGHNGFGTDTYSQGYQIPINQRTGIWKINLSNLNNGDFLINLLYVQDIPYGSKVAIISGKEYADTEFYKDQAGVLTRVPLITAPLDLVYYTDSFSNQYSGRIRIVENSSFTIDINNEILNKAHYTSPNGVVFTNGLKIRFDSMVVPASYAFNTYYVEGVGKHIRLVTEKYLVTPEFDQTVNGLTTSDYITINRSSIDFNAWSRSNRWFHEEVILASAKYNNEIPILDNTARASRSIIEFDPDLQLFNSGKIAYHNIDILDYTVTDAFTQVEGSVGAFYAAAGLADGMTIIFANDFDPQIKDKVFTVTLVVVNTISIVHLVESAVAIEKYDVIVPKLETLVPLTVYTSLDLTQKYNPLFRRISLAVNLNSTTRLAGVVNDGIGNTGILQGSNFWFDGASWIEGQSKSAANIAPLFDVVDTNLVSFGNKLSYINSSFVGNKIFSYKTATGKVDSVLGFPISYRNFNNIGDIEFTNNIDSNSFDFMQNSVTYSRKVNTGYISKIIDRNNTKLLSVWDTRVEPSKQYQIISNTFDGTNSSFAIDVLPNPTRLVPNLKVFVNSKIIPSNSYQILPIGIKFVLVVNSPMVAGARVDILIYSKEVSSLGYYEVPPSLDLNSLNASFSDLTLGQFRNHISAIVNNSTEVVGQVPGSSNLRDLDIKNHGGSILQHSAPLVYSSIFLTSDKLNFVDSISYAQREYTRFKNRFLESYVSVINNDITDPIVGVDYILSQLNIVKNKNSPWYYSDMVPYGSNHITTQYTVLNQTITEYEIDKIFDDTVLSNKAILVYLDSKQLTKGIDYTFNQSRPSIVFLQPLTLDSKIEIRIFENTDGCFIPDTPTKLGLYPKFKPEVYVDSTYQNPVSVILGHDGSITPKFNDIRDGLLLELELRIYNNIKISYNTNNFDINNFIPGKFRDTRYSRLEFNQILSRTFLNWAGSNRVDFSTNKWYDQKNAWTWSYSHMQDKIDGENLPGHWRGIYRYLFDTDEPNKNPWEMLGFNEMPNWWIDTYGQAPYTGGNMVLWNDLEQGVIRFGPTAGINPTYARPGLTKIIPVTDSGELKSPDQFILKAFDYLNTGAPFTLGDEGPVEAAWRRSSEYPFAVQQALALMVPGVYFGQLINVQDYNSINPLSQFVISGTNQRITPTDVIINGDTTSGITARSAGYLTWVSDYLVSNGLNPVTTLKSYLNNLDVRLGYKSAGFTDQAYLTVLAEQSSPTSTNDSIIIPDENYKIILNKSTPVDRITYSGVIIERTATGYTASGYDLRNPFFTIIPSEPNSNSYAVAVGDDSGIIYKDYKKYNVTIPYGYELNNKQQVVDFLNSYGRFLSAQGFVFEEYNLNLLSLNNWDLSAKEFLTWAQQGWTEGSIIILSPFSNKVTVSYKNAVVDEVSNLPTGSRIIDSNFNVVKNNLFNVVRADDMFTLTMVDGLTVGLIDLSLVQYEHVILFDNQTVFHDIIYKPELGNRQYRLKLVGNKTGNWTGQVNPAGFIYSNPDIKEWQTGQDYKKGDLVSYKNSFYTALSVVNASESFVFGYWRQIDKTSIKTGLLPNLAYNASKFINMYDVDNQVRDQDINKYSNGLIGYRDRRYLDDLNLNATTQTKFYQGYIRDKGTKDAISSLSSGIFNNLSGSLTHHEEWAFRVGEYGALNSNRYVEIQLSDSKYQADPISIALLNIDEVLLDTNVVKETKDSLYKKSPVFTTDIFANRNSDSDYTNDIETAGYVNLNDINTTVFDIQKIDNLDSISHSMYDGYKIWVAKDITREWGVYRVDSMNSSLLAATYALDSFATFDTSGPHNLTIGDIFIVRNFAATADGLYTVTRVDSITSVFVSIPLSLETAMIKMPVLTGHGTLFKLSSVRVDKMTDIANYSPTHGWKPSDKIWVDNDSTGWGVYSKVNPWDYSTNLIGTSIAANSQYGKKVAVSPDGNIITLTAPGKYANNVDIIIKDNKGKYLATGSVVIPHIDGVTVGDALVMNQTSVVVSAGNHTAPGIAHLFTLTIDHFVVTVADSYALTDTTAVADSGYGTAIALSEDNNWLFVSAPSAGVVQCYMLDPTTLRFKWSSNITVLPGIKFGQSLSTNKDGSVLLVGAPDSGVTIKAGEVVVFARTGVIFNSTQTLTVSIPQLYETFGTTVCLSDDELFVGAPGRTYNNYQSGIVYRYKFDGTLYQLVQEIKKPFAQFTENFGTVITVDKEARSLFVSSSGADSLTESIVDSAVYTLDSGATQLLDIVRNAGVVYVYDLLSDATTSKYCFSQELVDSDTTVGEEFGSSVVAHSGTVFVGTPNSDSFGIDTGKIAVFQNLTLSAGWSKIREEQPRVDLDMVTNLYLYDRVSETVLTNLDFIDPAKGKLLGPADEEITYKTSFDPAKYNKGSNTAVAIDTQFFWNEGQVGQLWLNMDLIRYVDYEQDSLTYRITNWGKLFPGSVVEVCEWIASDVLPSKYAFDGIPKHIDDSAYVQELIVDPVTGVIKPKYFYWVVNKSQFNKNLNTRRISALSVANLIENPLAQGITYAALLKSNSITLFGAKSFISADKTILHINYTILKNTNIIHSEYELVPEYSTKAIIPKKIIDKLIDSITGADLFGNSVPDYNLTMAERYGISIRPRQTMFANTLVATQNFVKYVNTVFATVPVALESDLSTLYLIDPIPTTAVISLRDPITGIVNDVTYPITITVATTEERSYINLTTIEADQFVLTLQDSDFANRWALYKVLSDKSYLVIKTQGYKTTDYWKKVDWFDSTYDSTIKPTYTVETVKDIAPLSLNSQDVVWVKNDGAGRFVVYRTNNDLTTSLVGIQEGTIQLSDALWAHKTNRIGFGNDNFDTVTFDLIPTIEFRNIIRAIKDDIFINTLDGEFNNLFFIMLDYIFTEQKVVDWAFKTSYISILHKLRKLAQYPNYIKDNQTFYESYINEVKPYRTKIREYVIDYEGDDAANMHPTDFDLPSYYDTGLNTWRSPSGEQARDAVILASDPKYADWLAYHTFYVDSVEIVSGGNSYSSPPLLVVEGGGGSGAVITASLDTTTGTITRIDVINQGKGYTSAPTIKIYGDGVDIYGRQTLICVPIIKNDVIRRISTTIKFDRIKRAASIKLWQPLTPYSTEIVVYDRKIYTPLSPLTSGAYFDPLLYSQLDAAQLESAQDRALAFYRPGPGQTPNDPNQLFSGTEYPGVIVDGVNYAEAANVELDTQLQSFYTDVTLGTRPEDVNVDGGKYIDIFSSHAPEELLPGLIYDTLDIQVFTKDPLNLTTNLMGYRIIKTMTDETGQNNLAALDPWEFRRISAAATTILINDLHLGDTEIHVHDASVLAVPSAKLAQPGIVYINGEKISYFGLDIVNNVISQIRRGVWGTGAPLVHLAGARVVDASLQQRLPGNAYSTTWLNPGTLGVSVVDGQGLFASNTEQASYIRVEPSYVP